MGRALALVAVTLLSKFVEAAAKITLLQLQRTSKWTKGQLPPAMGAPQMNPAKLNLQGFCKTIGCVGDECLPVCHSQPCCCWSSFAGEVHPSYPSPDETSAKQKCLYPPKGFTYAPEPGLTYDDGYIEALKKANLPTYQGRRLCCLRRSEGVQFDSQRDLGSVVPVSTTVVPTTTIAAGVPEPGEVNPAFTTEIATTSLMNPGDEYENAQMEEAARAHLAAANDLKSAVKGLEASAVAIDEVNTELKTNPNLVRSRKHVAEMRKAIRGWAERRWANLERLKTGDASSFDNAPAAPLGVS